MHRQGFRFFGYTLIELVVVIVLLGIVAAGVATFIVVPVEGYRDLTRRAALVDVAENALRRQERDLRNALPNSVRITNLGGGGYAIELLPILDGAMYRRGGGDGAGGVNRLNIGGNDTDWDIHKFFRHITVPSSSTTHRIVINNQGPFASNPAQDDAYQATGTTGVITQTPLTITYSTGGINGAHHINLSANHRFQTGSSYNRLYIIQTPVTYLCRPNAANPALGTLSRYESYPITATQPTDPAVAPLVSAASALMAGEVSACSANTTTAESNSRQLVTLVLRVEDQGEKVQLIHQVQVDNSQ